MSEHNPQSSKHSHKSWRERKITASSSLCLQLHSFKTSSSKLSLLTLTQAQIHIATLPLPSTPMQLFPYKLNATFPIQTQCNFSHTNSMQLFQCNSNATFPMQFQNNFSNANSMQLFQCNSNAIPKQLFQCKLSATFPMQTQCGFWVQRKFQWKLLMQVLIKVFIVLHGH